VPATDGSALHRNRERLIFLLSCLALAAHLAHWLVLGENPVKATSSTGGAQRFVLAEPPTASIPAAGAVFAAAEPAAYFDEAVPARWVQPKVRAETQRAVTLELPAPSFPVPPMLLPVPGPAIEFTSDLQRWPSFPKKQPGK
jgi:hypothetical protein